MPPAPFPMQPQPQGGTGPASPPTGNPGIAADALSKVREAVKMLELALQALPLGSEPHKAVAKAVSDLSRAAPASEEIPGVQATQLRSLAENAQKAAPMQALMRSLQQQQQQPPPAALEWKPNTMADRSPAFTPPLNRLIGDDPQIVKVPMDHTDFGSRRSAIPSDGLKNDMRIVHVPNGRRLAANG